jgi:hypothetical protein
MEIPYFRVKESIYSLSILNLRFNGLLGGEYIPLKKFLFPDLIRWKNWYHFSLLFQKIRAAFHLSACPGNRQIKISISPRHCPRPLGAKFNTAAN